MNSHGLTKENLIAAFPMALQKDKSVLALADAIADVLSRRPAEIDRLSIYANIDKLPEELLDILAYDFKVDWWDGNYTLEEKRRTLKENWFVHRHLGTKAAVERALSAIYPATKVEEWFEYGGEPFHFKLSIDATDDVVNDAKRARVLERLDAYKNLRSHLDGVKYYAGAESPRPIYAGAVCQTCEPPVYAYVDVPEEWKGEKP